MGNLGKTPTAAKAAPPLPSIGDSGSLSIGELVHLCIPMPWPKHWCIGDSGRLGIGPLVHLYVGELVILAAKALVHWRIGVLVILAA